MSFPKDLPPPDDFPPPPPPPTEEVKSKRGSSTSRPKQPLQSQAESKSTQHLSRKTPPPRPTAPKPVSEKVRAEAEKTAETAEQLNKEPVEPKKMPEFKKREGSGPKLPVALTPITIPKKPPIKPLFGPPASRPGSKSSSNRGTPEPASSEPSASRKSSDDTVPPEPRLRKGSRASEEELGWEKRFNDKRDFMAESEFSGASIGDLQREEIETLKNVEAKETEALNAKNKVKTAIYNLIQETLDTENSFLGSIKDLQGFFSKLEVLFAKEHSEFLSENLQKTKPAYFSELAVNWGKLRDSSRLMIEKLKMLKGGERTDQKDVIQAYLHIFTKPEIQEHLELLKTLTSHYAYTRKLITDKFKIEPDRESTKWINTFEQRIPGKVVEIPQLLIMPVQRAPRYQLLLETLLKYISKIPEYKDLVPEVNARINYLKSAVDNINESF